MKHKILSVVLFFCIGISTKGIGETIAIASDTTLRLLSNQELYAEIAHMDSVLFNAFNAHDVEQLKKIFSEDLEFYHDKGGLTLYKETIENFKTLFERNKNTGLRRDLVEKSLEVYPVKDYGAIETGIHKFCHVEDGKDDCGTFKFVQIWEKINGQWKVTRVLSYDH